MEELVLLDAGSGGRASQRLIGDIFVSKFANPVLASLDDAALISPASPRLAISTDSYTVTPLFFAGANIGSLAVNGTVNDVAMLGAKPLWLTAAFIIEEGLPIATLDQIACAMADAARAAGIKIITGDTKVTPKGTCDKIFITTTGIGEVICNSSPGGSRAEDGDIVILSGAVGDHGLAVMAGRENLSFLEDIESDCSPLNGIIEALIKDLEDIHTLRDPTRGGLATTLNEIAEQSEVCIEIDETRIPVHAAVREGSALLGLDPLYLANEGKFICILPQEQADKALEIIRGFDQGSEAAIIGKVSKRRPGSVILKTRLGGERLLGMLEGSPLPRIC